MYIAVKHDDVIEFESYRIFLDEYTFEEIVVLLSLLNEFINEAGYKQIENETDSNPPA